MLSISWRDPVIDRAIRGFVSLASVQRKQAEAIVN
jgi:hypothetical protein